MAYNYHHFKDSEKLYLKANTYPKLLQTGLSTDMSRIKGFKLFYPKQLDSWETHRKQHDDFFLHLLRNGRNLEFMKIYFTREINYAPLVNSLPYKLFLRLDQMQHLDIMFAGISVKNQRFLWSWITQSRNSIKYLRTQLYTDNMHQRSSPAVVSFETRKMFDFDLEWNVSNLSIGDLCTLFIQRRRINLAYFSFEIWHRESKKLVALVLSRLLYFGIPHFQIREVAMRTLNRLFEATEFVEYFVSLLQSTGIFPKKPRFS